MKFRHAFSIALAGALLGGFTNCTPPPESAESSPAKTAQTPPPEQLRVSHFHASRKAIVLGESVIICYGVENAQQVSIQPQIRELRPSYNRCFTATPLRTTTYRLTAKGKGGDETAEFTVKVQKPEPLKPRSPILTFLATEDEVQKGQEVTLCYSLNEAKSVRIDPPVLELEPVSKCFTYTIEQTTTFTLTAVDMQNREFQSQLTVRVK